MVAKTGLTKTSPKPEETEKTTVPNKRLKYTFSNKGARAKSIRPIIVIKGIAFTVLGMLNLWENQVR